MIAINQVIHRFRRLYLVGICFTATSLASPFAEAQIQELFPAADEARKAGKFEEAQKILTKIIDQEGESAVNKHGAKFGVIYYNKGVLELVLAEKLKRAKDDAGYQKWCAAAASSFETCFKDFPDGAGGKEDLKNPFHTASLQRWGDAVRGLNNHTKAVDLYNQFLAKRKKRDAFSPNEGAFYVHLATSNFLLAKPNIKDGIKHLEKGAFGKLGLAVAPNSKIQAYKAFSDAVIKSKDENVLVDFLDRNSGNLKSTPYEMYKNSLIFAQMGNVALKAEMNTLAFKLFALVPSTPAVIDDIKAIIKQLPKRRGLRDGSILIDIAQLKKTQKSLEQQVIKGTTTDATVLKSLVYMHQKAGNLRGVYAVLKQLEKDYSKSKDREGNLFNLVNISAVLDQADDTIEYGNRFLSDFKKSKKKPDVEKLLLTGLFYRGQYAATIEQAEKFKIGMKKPSDEHDVCLFVLGGSHFFLGNAAEADRYISQHAKEYPKSKLGQQSKYYQASNLTRLRKWGEAQKLLTEFLDANPNVGDNPFMANALYDLANCNYNLKNNDDALISLDRLEKDFKSSSVIDLAYSLKGNIYEAKAEFKQAENYYNLAVKTAKSLGHKRVVAQALFNLVGFLGSKELDGKPNPRLKDAVPYYDQFIKEYSDTPYLPQVAVYGLLPMNSVNRADEGLANLQKVIEDLAVKEKPFFLEESIAAFSKSFLSMKGNSADKLKKRFEGFKVGLKEKRALALIRIEVIQAYEGALKVARQKNDEKLTVKYEASIKAAFRDLKQTFKPTDLSKTILVKIGDYLRVKTSAPNQALPYYEELKKRNDKKFTNTALMGIASVKGLSPKEADKKESIATLKQILSQLPKEKKSADERALEEQVLYNLVELSSQTTNWADTEKYSRLYLDNRHSKKAAEMSYLFAVSFDKRGKSEDAIRFYSLVYGSYAGFLELSVPSIERIVELTWKRNLKQGAKVGDAVLKLDDRQAAYEAGANFIRRTKKSMEDDGVPDEIKNEIRGVAALVKKYEDSGEVKTLAEQAAEKNKRTR